MIISKSGGARMMEAALIINAIGKNICKISAIS